jgi:lipopolysaccharide export system protein LptA
LNNGRRKREIGNIKWLVLLILLAVSSVLLLQGEEETEVLVLEHAGRMNRRVEEERVILYLYEDVRWKKGETAIESDFATYREDEGWLRLLDGVTVTEPERTITSDTLDYYEEPDEVIARGNVVVSSENGTRELRTTNLVYRRAANHMTATNRPIITVTKVEEGDEGDTTALVIEGDRVIASGEDSLHVVGQVTVEGDSMNARCDSAFYDLEGDRIHLREEPVMSVTGYTAWGREIDLYAPEEELEEVVVRGDAEAEGTKKLEEKQDEEGEAREAGEERYWTSADSLILHFAEKKLQSLAAFSRAKSLVLREKPNGVVEKNYVTGQEIAVEVKDRKVEKVRVAGQGKGVYVMPPDTLEGSAE